jgi:hypothetical protein
LIKDSKLYDILKFVAQVFLPALGTAYFALAGIWDLPNPEQVVGTIVVVDTFLGTLLHISTGAWNKQIGSGTMVVNQTPTGKMFSLEFDGDPQVDLEGKKQVVFDIKHQAGEGGVTPET